MAPGKRRRGRQLEAFVVASDVPKSPDHPSCMASNRPLAENGFDHQPTENIRALLSNRRGELNASHRRLMIRRPEAQKTTWATGCCRGCPLGHAGQRSVPGQGKS